MRVGVIGVGDHASTNLYPSLGAAGLELVAVVARRRDRATRAAAQWGARQAFTDVREMLASVNLDGVIMSVHPSAYGPLISTCLNAGVPVFCEKPGASSAAEATELAALSERVSVPIVVGYMKRFAPAYKRAWQLTRLPAFGPPTLGTFTFAMGQGWGADLRAYLLENPVHHLDLARYLLGELTSLQAQVAQVPGFGQAVAAIATAASGAVCTFNLCSTASWSQRNEYVEIYGKGHAVWVENVDTCIFRPPERPEQVWRPNYTVPRSENSGAAVMGFLHELQHFRAVVTDGIENRSDIANAAQTLALAERLCEVVG